MDLSTLSWWAQLPYHLDNTLLTLMGGSVFCFGTDPLGGGFPIRFYGLMYLMAFFTVYQMMRFFIRRDGLKISDQNMESLLTYVVLGILLGGRLFYVIFYNWDYYSEHLGEVFMPFKNGQFVGIAGMSYHGGLTGAIVGGLLYIRKYKIQNIWEYLNVAFLCTPLGYTWGRLGNFLNGELYGRQAPEGSMIGMYFPSDPHHLLRYPSQIFEMCGEGLLLFGILLLLRNFKWSKDQMLPLYLMGYGVIRYMVEFFREPDAQLGLQALGMSRGQQLCATMILVGLVLFVLRRRYVNKQNQVAA